MRKVLLSLMVLGAAGTARAADLDYDYLRGSDYDPPVATVIDWSGVYIGGHGGYTSGSFNRRGTGANYALTFPGAAPYTNPIVLGTSRARGESYGAYAGYNAQFDNVVVGLEADYTHSGFQATTAGIVGQPLLPGAATFVGVNRSGISDYGTVRVRAGYAMDNFLPFITAGAAIGQWSSSQTLSSGTGPFTTLQQRNTTRTIGGFAVGIGMDYAITPNVVLRGEYQYINFENNNASFTQMNTIRGGAAVKF